MRTATGFTDLAAANVPHCHGSKGVSVTFPTGFKFTYSGDCRPSRTLAEIGKGSTVLLHEATFDDELRGDAEAKLHSTTSEAIGVGIAMGARRVLLTHFSQRYQKLPVLEGLDDKETELEDEPDSAAQDSMAPIDTEETPRRQMLISELVEDEGKVDDLLATQSQQSSSPTGRPGSLRITKVITDRHKPQHDMKIGVAFDYMRVKVKDIALLEKFTPALLKLYDQLPEYDSDARSVEALSANARNESINRQKSKIGGGRMGRVKQSSKDRAEVRQGVGLFDDQEGRPAGAAAESTELS